MYGRMEVWKRAGCCMAGISPVVMVEHDRWFMVCVTGDDGRRPVEVGPMTRVLLVLLALLVGARLLSRWAGVEG